MLDLLTIFSAVGLQQELDEAHSGKNLVISQQEESGSVLESAAGELSAVFDSFDSAVASVGAIFTGSSQEPQQQQQLVPAKKVD